MRPHHSRMDSVFVTQFGVGGGCLLAKIALVWQSYPYIVDNRDGNLVYVNIAGHVPINIHKMVHEWENLGGHFFGDIEMLTVTFSFLGWRAVF